MLEDELLRCRIYTVSQVQESCLATYLWHDHMLFVELAFQNRVPFSMNDHPLVEPLGYRWNQRLVGIRRGDNLSLAHHW